MRSRARSVAALLAVALLTGCTAQPTVRAAGDPLTQDDAAVLAELLLRNHRAGGADFVITAPYRDEVVLTLSGEVDFRNGVGRARAVTTFPGDRPDDVRTVFFTADRIWTGDVAGLRDALARAGAGPAGYLRRELTTAGDDGGPLLGDLLLSLLLRLTAQRADAPEAFLGPGYAWEGQRSIDSRLTTVYGLREGRTVAVSAEEDLLLQFTTPLFEGRFDATITLAEHGRRTVDLPAEEESAEVADHPEVAASLGIW